MRYSELRSVLGTMRMSSVPRTSIMLWSVVLLASMAFGCRQGAVIEPPDMKAPVRLGEVTVRTMEATVKVTGTLKASEQAVLITESEGRLIMGRNAASKRLIEGDEVEAGQRLGRVLDRFGMTIEEIRADVDGVVMMVRTFARVRPGDSLFILG